MRLIDADALEAARYDNLYDLIECTREAPTKELDCKGCKYYHDADGKKCLRCARGMVDYYEAEVTK